MVRSKDNTHQAKRGRPWETFQRVVCLHCEKINNFDQLQFTHGSFLKQNIISVYFSLHCRNFSAVDNSGWVQSFAHNVRVAYMLSYRWRPEIRSLGIMSSSQDINVQI